MRLLCSFLLCSTITSCKQVTCSVSVYSELWPTVSSLTLPGAQLLHRRGLFFRVSVLSVSVFLHAMAQCALRLNSNQLSLCHKNRGCLSRETCRQFSREQRTASRTMTSLLRSSYTKNAWTLPKGTQSRAFSSREHMHCSCFSNGVARWRMQEPS